MIFTKRNHFNPCFWTANWNPAYFANTVSGSPAQLRARDQRVHVLNVKSGKIYERAVDHVHYDKNIGVADMTPDDMRDFCKRYHPNEYEQFCRDIDDRPEMLYLDFEQILTGIENGPAYDALKNVIATQCIRAPDEKAMIAGFLVVHWHRSHAMFNSMLDFASEMGMKKFEHFILLKHELGDPNYLLPLAMTLAPFHWHYYCTSADTFPLNDSPVLITSAEVMIALSPRLMLAIDRTKRQSENSISYSNYIDDDRLEKFRRMTIGNTFREIIFSSPKLLQEWRDTSEFQLRHTLMKDASHYNELLSVDGARELWNINALANQ